MDEFLRDMIPELANRRLPEVVDVAMTAICVAAFKQHTSPRTILDHLWKEMDDERYQHAMRPALERLVPSAL